MATFLMSRCGGKWRQIFTWIYFFKNVFLFQNHYIHHTIHGDQTMNGNCPCAATQFMSSNGTYDNTLRPCSSSPASVQGWLDLANMPPKCPLNLIAYADLGGTAGTVISSSSFVITAATWSASPFTIVSAPLCVALGSG